MAAHRSETPRIVTFILITLLIYAAEVGMQEMIMRSILTGLFQRYELITNVVPSQWIVMERQYSSDPAAIATDDRRSAILTDMKRAETEGPESRMITMRGKKDLLAFARDEDQVLYFINPYLAFFPLAVFVAFCLTFLLSIYSPAGSPTALIRSRLSRTFMSMESQLRKQFESHDMGFETVLARPPEEYEELIRNSTLPEVVLLEMADYIAMRDQMSGERRNPFTPVKFFFRYQIAAVYGNAIQGVVAGGAAVLIFIIGLRGLKLIPAEEPSLILMSLSLEFILLIVLMLSFLGSAQEERLDRVIKELEAEQRDAIRQQTVEVRDVITRQAGTLQTAIGGSAAEGRPDGAGDSLSADDERRILDALLERLLDEAERRRSGRA